MAKHTRPTDISRRQYAALARSPLHSLAFVLPLLVFFHVSFTLTRPGADGTPLVIRHMELVFQRLGGVMSFLPALAVVVVLVMQHLAHKDRLAIYPGVLGCMVIESLLWMLPMIAMLHLAGLLYVSGMLSAQTGMPNTVFGRILVGVGASIYEEFIFRLVLIGLILLALVDVLSLPKNVVTVIAVLLTAVAFSLYHPNVLAEDSFPWWLFLFYAVTGAYLGALFLLRGFAIVVGAHCLFNIYKALMWFG